MLLAGFRIDDIRIDKNAGLDSQLSWRDRGRLAGAHLDPLPASGSEFDLVDARWKLDLGLDAVKYANLLAGFRIDDVVRIDGGRRAQLARLRLRRERDDP